MALRVGLLSFVVLYFQSYREKETDREAVRGRSSAVVARFMVLLQAKIR